MGYPLRWEQLAAPQYEEQTQEEIVVQSVPRPKSLRRYFRRLVLLTFAGSVLLVLSVVIGSRFFLSDPQSPALRLDAAPAGTMATAVAPKIVRHVGFVVVTGRLVNRTGASLDRVEAVVDLLDGDRRTLSTQAAMVERDSIAPGQAASFQLAMVDVPEAQAYRLRFKKLYGSDIN